MLPGGGDASSESRLLSLSHIVDETTAGPSFVRIRLLCCVGMFFRCRIANSGPPFFNPRAELPGGSPFLIAIIERKVGEGGVDALTI